MINLTDIKSVYFIGIGGIGMSNIARYMAHIGKSVSGYDKTVSPITKALAKEGIEISNLISINKINAENFQKETTLIVYTPAVKRTENEELNFFINQGYLVVKRAEILGIITKNTICLAVAGTHGKTTTSSILGHILKFNNVSATSFLGGISENYRTNLILGGDKYSVVEADEYDRSFLNLFPDYACITATDADHLDIYENDINFKQSFQEFANLVSSKLIVKNGTFISGYTFGIEDDSDYVAKNIRIENERFVFDVSTPSGTQKDIFLNIPGRHNILNALAALSLAESIGLKLEDISTAIATFLGVERRFSYRLKTPKKVIIDDYAHHPTEINALANAVRELYPNDGITIVFQPHTYTRTRDFMEGFVESLATFDEVILIPIYAAREHPIDDVNTHVLKDLIVEINPNAHAIEKSELISKLKLSNNRIVLMVGAGDIGEIVEEVANEFKNNIKN